MTNQACCFFWKDMLSKAGERGQSAFVVNLAGHDVFVIQMRCMSDQAAVLNPSYPVVTDVEFVVKFCPNCGKDLVRFYGSQMERYRREDLRIKWWGK
jgi:hypothetical protein